MFLGFNSGRGRIAGAALGAAGFTFGVLAATTIRLVQLPTAAASTPPIPQLSSAPVTATLLGYPAEVIRVLDGDTFEGRVRVWPGLDITTKVRLRGIDAPEMRARCAEERLKAEAARDALSALLARGHVAISRVSLGKYGGRVIAEASALDTRSVAEALLASGHVRRYAGGRRRSWCGGRPF